MQQMQKIMQELKDLIQKLQHHCILLELPLHQMKICLKM